MLPVVESDGRSTAFAIVMYALALVPVSLAPTLMGMSGWTYFAGALLLGLRHAVVQPAHVDHEADSRRARSPSSRARHVLQASVIYLPLLFALMMLNRA